MPKNAKTIRLLMLNTSQNEAEELINLLRNAGRATQAQRIESMEHLTELLQQRRPWDLCFAAMNAKKADPFDALDEIKKLEQDIPVILLTQNDNQDDLLKALHAGMRDAVPSVQQERLQLVALRELENLYDRRKKHTAEVALREAEKRCRLLLDSSRDAIAYLHDGMHIYSNSVYVKLFGYSDFDDLEGLPAMDLVTADDQAGFKAFLKSFTNDTAETHQFNYRAVKEGSSDFDVKMSLSLAQYDGENCTQVIIRPVVHEAEQITPGNQDTVTGLRNIASFNEQVDKAIEKAYATQQKYAVLCIQPDKIAELESRIDTTSMNKLLSDIARTLQEVIKPPHILASMGATEFAALLTNCDTNTAQILAQKTCDAVAQLETETGEQTLDLTASIGISILNENTENPEEIIAKAREAAEFVTNHSGTGNSFHLHNTDAQYEINTKKALQLLQQALEQQLFTLVYQPIVSLHGSSAKYYESLLRMPDGEGSEISPSHFLKTAHASGLIIQIERWAIETAIRTLAEHILKEHKTDLFINISAESIGDTQLVPWLGELLNELQLPGDSIIFQISETDLLADQGQVYEFVDSIATLQCKTALTNFSGTLSSIQAIEKIPFSYIKIDSSYITKLTGDDEAREELKTLVSSLQAQGKLTIAPVVDSAGLLPILWQAGVNYIQGYYIQQPSNAMDYDFATEDEDEAQ